jgi:hypothetical protein
MLKRYSFYGISLELIAVAGIFLAVLVIILLAARREAIRSIRATEPLSGKKGRS